jgi:hypothetical protein
MSPRKVRGGIAGKSRIEQWEQQPAEPPGAFEQFLLYLHQPPGDRQINESYLLWIERQTGTRPVSKHPPGSYYGIARKYQWEVRARAFDRESNRKVYAKIESRRAKMMLDTMEAGRVVRERATAAARMLVPVTQTIGERDGREVILVETNINPSEIARLLKVGAELEQFAMGNSTERLKPIGDIDNPFTLTGDTAKDELLKRIEEVRKRRELAQQAAEE